MILLLRGVLALVGCQHGTFWLPTRRNTATEEKAHLRPIETAKENAVQLHIAAVDALRLNLADRFVVRAFVSLYESLGQTIPFGFSVRTSQPGWDTHCALSLTIAFASPGWPYRGLLCLVCMAEGRPKNQIVLFCSGMFQHTLLLSGYSKLQ